MSASQDTQEFLQALMTHGALTEDQLRTLYSSITDSPDTGLRNFLDQLNKQIKPLDLEIACSRLEDSYERYYGLVNRAADPAASIASQCSPAELEFFNKLLESLVGNKGVSSSTELLNCATSMERKLSAAATEEFLKRMVESKWLSDLPAGKIGAGPRLILELRPFLSDIFPDEVVACKVCKENVIRGDSCGNEGCSVVLHLLCIAHYAKGRASLRCPGCNQQWLNEVPDITIPGNDEAVGSSASLSNGHPRKTRRL